MADGKTIAPLFLTLTAKIVAAYVCKNPVPASAMPSVIQSVHQTLRDIASGETTFGPYTRKPAVPANKSVTADYIICLEDGRKLKTLKRYLRAHFGLSPDAYRTKWRLPFDYPMVASEYATRRSALAKKIGLGRTGRVPGNRRKRG